MRTMIGIRVHGKAGMLLPSGKTGRAPKTVRTTGREEVGGLMSIEAATRTARLKQTAEEAFTSEAGRKLHKKAETTKK